VLATLVFVEWLAVLALALTVRHSGWIYYQGGDQLWYYTLGWLYGHGQMSQTLVGYGWSVVLAPISCIAGPNLVAALPAILLLNVLVLLPAAMLALYSLPCASAMCSAGRCSSGCRAVHRHRLYEHGVPPATNTLPPIARLTAMSDFPTTVTLSSPRTSLRASYSRASPASTRSPGGRRRAAIAVKLQRPLLLPALAFAYRRASSLPAASRHVPPCSRSWWKERGLEPSSSAPAGGTGGGAQLAAGAPSPFASQFPPQLGHFRRPRLAASTSGADGSSSVLAGCWRSGDARSRDCSHGRLVRGLSS
jgi:hypothetical protein